VLLFKVLLLIVLPFEVLLFEVLRFKVLTVLHWQLPQETLTPMHRLLSEPSIGPSIGAVLVCSACMRRLSTLRV